MGGIPPGACADSADKAAVAIPVMAMTENAPRANIGDRFILFLLFFQRLGRGG